MEGGFKTGFPEISLWAVGNLTWAFWGELSTNGSERWKGTAQRNVKPRGPGKDSNFPLPSMGVTYFERNPHGQGSKAYPQRTSQSPLI